MQTNTNFTALEKGSQKYITKYCAATSSEVDCKTLVPKVAICTKINSQKQNTNRKKIVACAGEIGFADAA